MCFTLHTAYMNAISIVNKIKTGPSFCQTAWIIYWRRHKLDKHTDEWVITLGDRCTPQEAEDVHNKHIIMTAFSLCSSILFRLQCWWRVKTIQPLLSGWRESDREQRENIFIIRICLFPRRMGSPHTNQWRISTELIGYFITSTEFDSSINTSTSLFPVLLFPCVAFHAKYKIGFHTFPKDQE